MEQDMGTIGTSVNEDEIMEAKLRMMHQMGFVLPFHSRFTCQKEPL